MNTLLAIVLAATVLTPQKTGYSQARMSALSVAMPGALKATATLPRFATNSRICDLAEEEILRVETGRMRQWVKETKEQIASLPEFAKRSLFYECESSMKHDDWRLISVLTFTSTYSGGAHGMTESRTYNFSPSGRFGLAKALKSDVASKSELERILIGKALAKEGALWIEDGSFEGFSKEQLDRFWVDRSALVFEFDPYELGPYSSGGFSLRVPKSEIKHLVQPAGPLGFWAKG